MLSAPPVTGRPAVRRPVTHQTPPTFTQDESVAGPGRPAAGNPLERPMRIRWRGLELPSRVVCNREKLTDTYGEFHVEPFERGFGHTVGNSLRRILLSSLEGSAVTKIKIQGVQHEFSSIPGMVEDI